jgi:hypothetical protein
MPTFEELALHINTSEPRDLIWTSTIFSWTTAGYLSGLRLSNWDNGSIHNFTDIRVRSVR